MAQGCSAWELGQEHLGEPGASEAFCGSCAETGVKFTVDPRTLTLPLAFLEFFHDKTESFFGMSEGPVLSHHPWCPRGVPEPAAEHY